MNFRISSIFDCFVYLRFTEIYRIVSQKQIRDPPEGDTIRPQNVEPIDVKPTMNADGMRKQCCQWLALLLTVLVLKLKSSEERFFLTIT